MAKTRGINEEYEVRINAETSTEDTIIEQPAEEKKEQAPVATVSTGKKNVKVRIVEEVDCLIACKPYRFEKDKEVTVPSDVAAILCYAKKAFRL